MLRAVSHDLRSPLTAIRTAAEGLHDTSLDLAPEDRAALEAAILGEAQRLDRLVENLLDLSRLEVGAAEPRPEIWTMDGLLARALESVASDAERVTAVVPPDVRPVRVDGAHAERILVNLLENALAYSPVDEPVQVVVEDTGAEIVTRVIDRGAGISPRELERLFEPFERGGAAAAPGGSGLGLAIASGFAQVNGGRVLAEPAPGGGTVFALALPAVPAPGRDARVTAAQRVLVVDDEPQILRALQTNLRGAGYEVRDGGDRRGGARGSRGASAGRRDPRPRPARRQRHGRLPRAARAGARCRSSFSRRSATSRRRSRRSTRAPTTT